MTEEQSGLGEEIRAALNRHSAENGSDTPDFLLAEFLVGCLETWNRTTRKRDEWHGFSPFREYSDLTDGD